MSNGMWDLIGKCWSQGPSSRPQTEDIVKKMRELQDVDASVSQNDDSSQQPSVDPSPCSGHLPLYSTQSTNEPYPLGFRPRQAQLIPVPMTEARPPSLGPPDVYYASDSREAYFQATPGPSTPLTRTTFSHLPCRILD